MQDLGAKLPQIQLATNEAGLFKHLLTISLLNDFF
jgi:hypothetical protein